MTTNHSFLTTYVLTHLSNTFILLRKNVGIMRFCPSSHPRYIRMHIYIYKHPEISLNISLNAVFSAGGNHSLQGVWGFGPNPIPASRRTRCDMMRAMLVCAAPTLRQARPPASLSHGALPVALLFRPKTQGPEELSNFLRPSPLTAQPQGLAPNCVTALLFQT